MIPDSKLASHKPLALEALGRETIALAIPAYNSAWSLPRLLTSATAQAFPFDEILVYDDRSTDTTAEIAAGSGAAVIRGESNIGCSAGKNRLLQETKCKWIHFHDADDELLPNFTSLAHRWVVSPNCPDVVIFDYEYRDNDTGELLARVSFDDTRLSCDPVQYAIVQQINPFCGLYRVQRLREVGGYDLDPKILYNEDVAFHCKLALQGFSFRAENEVSIINYRVRNSMSGSNDLKCLKAQHTVMKNVAAAVGTKYREEIATRLWYLATSYACRLMWKEMDEVLHDALEEFPGIPPEQSRIFRMLCRIFGPHLGFRLREYLLRLLKPHTRTA